MEKVNDIPAKSSMIKINILLLIKGLTITQKSISNVIHPMKQRNEEQFLSFVIISSALFLC
jgi:hypothetical protein